MVGKSLCIDWFNLNVNNENENSRIANLTVVLGEWTRIYNVLERICLQYNEISTKALWHVLPKCESWRKEWLPGSLATNLNLKAGWCCLAILYRITCSTFRKGEVVYFLAFLVNSRTLLISFFRTNSILIYEPYCFCNIFVQILITRKTKALKRLDIFRLRKRTPKTNKQ